jgi:hypothetical protein
MGEQGVQDAGSAPVQLRVANPVGNSNPIEHTKKSREHTRGDNEYPESTYPVVSGSTAPFFPQLQTLAGPSYGSRNTTNTTSSNGFTNGISTNTTDNYSVVFITGGASGLGRAIGDALLPHVRGVAYVDAAPVVELSETAKMFEEQLRMFEETGKGDSGKGDTGTGINSDDNPESTNTDSTAANSDSVAEIGEDANGNAASTNAGASGARTLTLAGVDVTKREQVEKAFEECRAKFGMWPNIVVRRETELLNYFQLPRAFLSSNG